MEAAILPGMGLAAPR